MSFIISLIRRLSSKKFFPIFWTILTITLLCLPGKAIPSLGLFGIKNLDKVAHIGLFGGFVLFWGLYAWGKKKVFSTWMYILSGITLTSIFIGIGMEYVQVNFIPNRSFDVWDIWADVLGSVVSFVVLVRFGKELGLRDE